MKKITQKQFDEFKKEFLFWQNKFCLSDYRVVFSLSSQISGSASIKINGNYAIVSLKENATDMEDANTHFFGVKHLAKHEAIHLLLSDISRLAYNRFCAEEDIYLTEEKLVERLSKLL